MRNRAGELLSQIARAWVGLVLGLLLGVLGLIQAVQGARTSAYFLVIAALASLILVLTYVAYRALGERDQVGSGEIQHHTHNYYNAPVTIQQSTAPSGASPRVPVGPERTGDLGKPESLPVIKLYDYVEFPDGRPLIRDRIFRNVLVKGPLIVALLDGLEMINIGIGAPMADLEAMLWPVAAGTLKGGLVGIENCRFENCLTENVAFAGIEEELDKIRGVGKVPPKKAS
jgi:hypothetical protein